MSKIKAKLLVVRRHWAQVGEERERERITNIIKANDWLSPIHKVKLINLIEGETNGNV
jgi:hypothetical protein